MEENRKDVINVGVIGASGIGQTHLASLSTLQEYGEVKIVAVADSVEANARKAANQYQCDYHLQYQDLLKRDDIQLVHVCTPSGLHGEMAIAAARAKKHVIVEKPMEISLQKASAMIDVSKEEGVILSVIKQNRFAKDIRRIKKAIDNGLFGRVTLVNASVNWFRSQEYFDSSNWRGTWAGDGGGAVMNQGIHTVDLLLHLAGNCSAINGNIGTLGHDRIEVEDVATATVKFSSGALGVFTSTTCAYPGFSVRIEVFGSDGSAIIKDNQVVFWQHRNHKELPAVDAAVSGIDENMLDLHGMQIYDVLQAIREGRKPKVTGKEGIRSLQFIHSLYERNVKELSR